MSIGKSREGSVSPYQEDLIAPPRPNTSSSGISHVVPGSGTPTSTTRPARSRAWKDWMNVSLMPTASMTTSAPNPPVSPLIPSTASVFAEFTVWVAPNLLACSSLASSMSTAMIVVAPANAAPAIAATPTPPQPMTATDSPSFTSPVLIAAPTPAMTPQPNRPTAAYCSGARYPSIFVHCPAATSVFSANAPIPNAGSSGAPSSNVIFCLAVWVAKQYHGSPRLHARQSPHTARQLRITRSPGARSVTSSPTAETIPVASWPSRNGKSSLTPPTL